jgi:hypothetical protein
MSSQKSATAPESDPFHEPLEPLPAGWREEGGEGGGRPELVEMEPERFLPPEDEQEGGLAEAEVTPAEVEYAVAERLQPPRWKFWKRPSKRDRQLETLRQGASEMVGLMRSIRDHLEAERGDREGLCKTLSPLPVAVASLKSMSEHQADAGRVLGELRTTMQRRADHDTVMIESLNRIGETMGRVDETFHQMDRTLAGIDRSNQRSLGTLQKLGERVEDSDRFLNETFARLREAEREFIDYVGRSSRRSGFAMMALCSILLMSVVAVGFMFKENRELLTAVQRSGSLVVQVPERTVAPPVTILEELEQVDDGIGDPDREIARAAGTEPGEGEADSAGGDRDETPLLSVNKLPERE